MPYKFDEHDATDLSRMIRRRRPEWTHQGIMKSLQQAAEAGATLGQVTTAAEKSTQNKKALTPAAIMWPEHWTTEAKTPNMTGTRLCAQCDPARKHAVTDMTEVARGVWICHECSGASAAGVGA
ncbi:hypothetical protein AB4Z38_06940 [Arthrobacter sp. 2RAF6]|uniref:hypothetical protein n=1 Tax=Arthrobacter sp. 2RAF6 TaxID=3233002 RepID=UPI003F90EF2C